MFTKHRLGVKDKGKCKVTAPTLWEGKKGKSEIRQRRKQFLILMVYVFKKMIIVSKISPKVFLIVFYPFFLTPNLDLLPVIQLARCRPVPPAYNKDPHTCHFSCFCDSPPSPDKLCSTIWCMSLLPICHCFKDN